MAQSGKVKVAKERNWTIFRLRGMKATAQALDPISPEDRQRIIEAIEDTLANMGARR